MNDPELVLADEPTGKVTSTRRAVPSCWRCCDRSPPAAVVLVTHEPAAAAIADRIVHLRDGRLTSPARDDRPRESA